MSLLGEPQFEPLEGVPGLLHNVNTNCDILLEASTSRDFLPSGGSWLGTSDVVNGPWRAGAVLPSSFGKLSNDDYWQSVKQSTPGKRAVRIPQLFTATRPSE